ncbi:hypothetical protein [Treponema endosymbiont of Eucomonympha sp.]|uniref:hypothetical protein n=1 Tax=Treponema endosymbiont of Eucomonympha sp. TaxID=1580831 RepID=UPI000782EBE8|nr:hypothetical protein [Treponema endosymbiont of Eucomonympha sp.]
MEAKEARGESGSPRAFSEAPPEAEINDVTVSGAAGEPLSPYIVAVHVMHVVFPFEFMHMDVAPWFLGFPPGVSALVTAMGGVGGFTTIEISLTGTPSEGIAGLIKLRIPGDYLSSGETLDTDDNPNAVWDIEGRSARVNDAVVAGGVGNPLDYTITGRINHDYWKNMSVDVPCESWFLGGFPAGLSASLTALKISLDFSIHITGTPSETFGGLIKLRIPGAFLSSGIELYTDENPNAKWEIGRGEAAIGDVSVNGTRYAPIAPVSARISALTLVTTQGRDFAVGMAFAKLVLFSQSFPKSSRVFLRGAGWYFSMAYSPDDMSYHLRFVAPAGQHDIWSSFNGWSGCQLGDFSFDAGTLTAAGPFGAATAVDIWDDSAFYGARFYAGFRAVEAGADLSAWFTNLPAGLSAKAAEGAAEGALSVGVTFSGTPQSAASEEIEAFVPGTVSAAGMQLDVQPNENAVFAIEPNPPGATLSQDESGTGSVLIRGFVGKDISTFSQNLQAYIILDEDTFASKIVTGYDISGWLDNAPGISLTCTQSLSPRKKIQIRFGGIPERLLFAPIRITIPADCIDQDKETFVAEDDDNRFEFYTAAYIGDVTVAGVAGTPIAPVTARVGVVGDDFFALPAGAPVDEIFRNRIPGLSFLAAADVPDKADYVDCAISGTPQYALSNEIYAEVPAGMLRGGHPAQAPNNPNAKFAIEPAPEATVGDVTVSGTAGAPIAWVAAVVTVHGDTFHSAPLGTDCSAWFKNLPEGLTAEALAGIFDGAENAVLVIEGTPEEASDEAFELEIPASALYGDEAIAVTANPNAKFAINPAPGPAAATVGDAAVAGTAGQEITPVPIEISVSGDKFRQMTAGTDCSAWFQNLPAGLTAEAPAGIQDGAENAVLTVEGTPEGASSAAFFLIIPAAAVRRNDAIPVTANPNAKFAIEPAPEPAAATVGNATVAGTAGQEITPVPIEISVSGDKFRQMTPGTDCSAWFQNLPEGLTAEAPAGIQDGAENAALTVEGTPEEASGAAFSLIIPAAAVRRNDAIPVTANPNAKFDIGSGPEPVGVEFVALSANGSADAETSAVFLAFSQDVPSLSAGDISIALPGGTLQTGGLTADGGGRYTLAVSGVSESATATVAVSKTGFAFSPAARTAFVYGAPVAQKSAAIGDVVVAGSSFVPIEPVTARISVTNDSLRAIAAEADVSAWFTNLPEGLSAAAAETADGADFMEAEISGTPAGGAAGPIEAEIPASALHGGAAVPVEINPNAVYAIDVPAAQATIDSVVVAGTAWEAISPAAARFAIIGDKFRAITAGKDLSLWFQNLPAGLSAKAAGTADKSEHAEAVLEGTPATGMLGTIQAQIPAAALYGNTAVAVALNANAIFAINPPPFSWELKKEITDQDYETLTQGDDRVALRCLAKAEIWVKGKILATGNEYNTSDEVIRELVLKRGVYELFVFNSYEERAEEKYRDLIELIESYFGEVDSKIPDGGGTSDEPWIGPAVGAMAPAKDWGIRYGR